MVVPLALTSLHANELPRRLCPVIVVREKNLMLVPFETQGAGQSLRGASISHSQEHLQAASW